MYFKVQLLHREMILRDFTADCGFRRFAALDCVLSLDSNTRYSYRELDQHANRLCHFFAQHFEPLSTVALMMENRAEYPAMTIAMAKLGVTVACINTNLTGTLLLNSLATAKTAHLITTRQCLPQLQSVTLGALQLFIYEDLPLASLSCERPSKVSALNIIDHSLLNSQLTILW